MYPLIGILAEVDDEHVCRVLHAYIASIEKAGAIPLLLPFVEGEAVIDSYVDLCDGFFFTGGADIDPVRYGEEKRDTCGEIQSNRDAMEFRVLEKVMRTKKPILGICRGAQLINAALGGTLYQDLPTELQTTVSHRQTEAKFSPSHSVNVIEGTPLWNLIGEGRMVANSFHHQAVKRLAPGLKTFATADDGIVEGFYMPGEQYLYAYQWHPERLWETDEFNRRIFESFIAACKKRS